MLGQRIAYLRKARGISQFQLALALNLSPSAVGMYEQGRRTPDLDTLVVLSRLFETSLDYLVTGTEYTPEMRQTNLSNPKHQSP